MTIYRQDEQHAPYGTGRGRADPTPGAVPDVPGLTPRPLRYLDRLLDDIRDQIQPSPPVVELAQTRRDHVLTAAATLPGVTARFASGSLAHGTAICPIHRRDQGLDADGGVVLDTTNVWTTLGPETARHDGPDAALSFFKDGVLAWLHAHGHPRATIEVTKRALLVRFHAPLPSGEDPTVDLIVGLPRFEGQQRRGLWIPNTEQHRWDSSDPQEHTRLFNGEDGPTAATVTWARTVRLAKAENKRTDPPALCSFNVEALAYFFLPGHMPLPEALLAVWSDGADDLARHLTLDPAGVSRPIKVADRQAAAVRWREAAACMRAALDPAATDAKVRAELRKLWPDYVPDESGGLTRARTAAAMARGQALYPAAGGGLATFSTRPPLKSTRAFGQR